MLKWVQRNVGLLLIFAALAGWGAYSVGSRMVGTAATPPGYAYTCFDSGDIASNCVYLADPSAQTGWVSNPNVRLELISYRTGRNSSNDASVLVWSGTGTAPCGFKNICYVAGTYGTFKMECLVMKVYDAACN